ncbi:MAG: 3'(2'),5'-bisphosphate nucleotidase CysQ [Saprospiraceae bacterium]
MVVDKTLIDIVKKISIEAGKIILSHYNDIDINSSIEIKSDKSPVTIADKESSSYIIKKLLEATPDIPVISEEENNYSYQQRKSFDYFWLIDPLDGTKEFINKNGEFTTNIALIHKKKPIFGVVHSPVMNTIYWAAKNQGAFLSENNITKKINTNNFKFDGSHLRIVVSRSHLDDKTINFLSTFKYPVIIKKGSSLKFMQIAEGKADLYFRFNSISEWDTAASHIIVEEAGGKIKNILTNKNINYNKKNMKIPGFIVTGTIKN